jgi:ATP-dependent DNA helicase RecG
LADIAGVGPKRAEAFRLLGLRCVADLLRHLPLRYEHELAESPIDTLNRRLGPEHGSSANLAARGEVASVRFVRSRRPRVEATLEDGTGTILLTWFNAPWLRDRLHPGLRISVIGKAKRHGDYVQIINPSWRAIEEEPGAEPPPRGERMRPVYSSGEGVNSSHIEKALGRVLGEALVLLEDHLHEPYRRRRALPTLAQSYRMLHQPRSLDEVEQGRRRLAFDELLMLQLGVMLKRRHRCDTLAAIPLRHTAAIRDHILARFPFALTPSQDAVIREIAGDLGSDRPMNRLLQGDVGAGKTVVALYAMLLAVASGHQACLMAPTALLAEQHHAAITAMLAGGRVRIEWLTAGATPPQRRAMLAALADGSIDILIGTHALLTESVRFASLALCVIDEQHRFGVHQRATLRAKSTDRALVPHTLVLTATPIPRTLSLTLFGDLDISTISELPPGRKPIITRHVPDSKSGEVYDYLAKRLRAGEQAYIVVPVVDESAAALKDVRTHLESLQTGPLRGLRLAAVHGRLKRDARESIMQRFRAGHVDALIATTVIEVGVDVPNASLMVIEHADRFGLAQLHQLRGRIGRGSKRSLCVLIADPVSDEAAARLAAIASTTDGFRIAELDLELRGPGDVFGARQSGAPPFLVAKLPDDLRLLQLARRDARAWIEENPTLEGERDALLRKRLIKAHGKWLGLGDVA